MNSEPESCRQLLKQIVGALPCAYVHGEVFVNGKGEGTDYAVTDINHAFTEITGISRERILGKRINGLFSISSAEEDVQVFARVALTGEPIQREFLSPFFGMHFRIFCFSPRKGYFVALLTDLSPEKKFQERVEFLRDFANSTADEFFILDPSGSFVLGNRSVSEKLGVSQTAVPGLHLSRLNTLAGEGWWNTLWSSLLQKGSLQFETEHRGFDGNVYPVELSIDLMTNGNRKYAAVVAKNISSKRALSSALLKDQRYAEKAASVAGFFVWMVDSEGSFRPILGGEEDYVSGPVADVFFSRIHPNDRDYLTGGIGNLPEGSTEFRLKTRRGMVYHRAVWSRVEDNCVAGICYPLAGAGLSGSGSQSAAMDTYCLMTESVYRRTVKLKEALDEDKLGAAIRIVSSITSEFSNLTGQTAFPERVGFDSFLDGCTGMLKQLLSPSIILDIDTSSGVSGLVDPSFLENVLVRLLLIVQKTENAERVLLQSRSLSRYAGVIMSVFGREGIQDQLERLFIPVRGSVPGLASVYAMVRSAGGRVEYETVDNRVEFSVWFPRAGMSDQSASVLIALPDSVDAARAYASLRDAGYSVAIENSIDQIRRRLKEDGTGVLVASASMPDFTPEELIAGSSVTLVQVGGKPPGDGTRHLPDGFRTSELVAMVNGIISRVEKPPAEGPQAGILWAAPHLTPPLS